MQHVEQVPPSVPGQYPEEPPPRLEWAGILARARAWARMLAWPAAAVALAAVLVRYGAGVSAVDTAGAFFRNAFGTREFLAETLLRSIPLVMTGLGTMVAIRSGLWNIGAEGQIVMGAMGGFVALDALTGWPVLIALPVAFATAAVFGAGWALFPAILRATRDVSEILTTLLMNFVALALLEFSLTTWLKGTHRSAVPNSAPISPDFHLPLLLKPTRLHFGLVLVAATAVLVGFFFRTPRGFRMDLVGANPRLATQAGLHVRWGIVGMLLASGAIAGVAGVMQVAGTDFRLDIGVAGGVGFLGLLVAVLGRARVLLTVIAAVAFAALLTGAGGAENLGVPRSLVQVVQGLIVLAVVLQRGRRR